MGWREVNRYKRKTPLSTGLGGVIAQSETGFANVIGGKGGIRTPDTVNRMPDFESGAFDHSATFPGWS